MFISNICFNPQGSFGDLFVLCGAINWFSERCNHLFVPILDMKPNLYETAKCLFKDNDKITIIKYNDPVCSDLNQFIKENNLSLITEIKFLGYSRYGLNTTPLWDEQCYTILDIPYSIRYRYFKMPDVEKDSTELYDKIVKNENYIIIANSMFNTETKVELNINKTEYQVIELNESLCKNLILFEKLIKNATEIHCVPSGIFHFVDSISNSINGKLYFHNIRKSTIIRINNRWNNYKWNIIEYDSQINL